MKRTKNKTIELVIEKLKKDFEQGDLTLAKNLLHYVPEWDMMNIAFGYTDFYKFVEEKHGIKSE